MFVSFKQSFKPTYAQTRCRSKKAKLGWSDINLLCLALCSQIEGNTGSVDLLDDARDKGQLLHFR